jgi:23S rRNA (adenine2503-C2)-methyltransferase
MEKTILCGLTADEILEYIGSSVYTLNHSIQLTTSIYKKRIQEFSGMPKIPKMLKKYLEYNALTGIIPPVGSQVSTDGSVKYLFRTDSGKEFETVFIPDGRRNTVCVSTQSGCRMGCPFCVTSSYGFAGNLTAGEIVSQVISIPYAEVVTHVVFMGMGEPMDNIDNVLRACDILTAEWGLSVSPRNITVSTVGITPGVVKFLENSSCNLTVSLHSPFTNERKLIIPAERKYPMQEIIRILKEFPLKKNRRISVAYVMIKSLNDTDLHLNALKELVGGSEIRVNLLPYNMVPEDSNVSSTQERMQYFKHNLVISGISASVRKSRGADIFAACGLLATGLRNKDQTFS